MPRGSTGFGQRQIAGKIVRALGYQVAYARDGR